MSRRRWLVALIVAAATTVASAGFFSVVNVKTIALEPSGACSNVTYPASNAYVALDTAKTCECQAGTWVCENYGAGAAGAPTNGTYIVQTPNGSLSAEQALSLLASGLMVNATTTGVVSIYGGSACTGNNWVKSLDAAGAATCTQTAFSNLSGTATDAQIPDTITVNLAATATALAADPADCVLPQVALGINAAGTAQCGTPVGSGDVTGPASSTDNALPRFNGTGGKTLQAGQTVEDDSGNVIVAGSLETGDPGDGLRADTFRDNTATIPDPGVSSKSNIGSVAGQPVWRANGQAMRSMLYTAGGNYNAFTCTAGTCATNVNSIDGTMLALASQATGALMYYNGTDWIVLAAGTANQSLQMNGGATAPTWVTNGAGEANTTAAVGGELSVLGTTPKAGVVLNFKTFAAVDFNLVGDVVGIDGATWASLAAVKAIKHEECFTLFDRTALQATDDIPSVWRAPQALTVVAVWCEGDEATGTVINLQRDDGTPANVLSANKTCTTTAGTGTIDTNEDNFAAGDRLDLVVVSVAGTPAKRLNVCVEYTYD